MVSYSSNSSTAYTLSKLIANSRHDKSQGLKIKEKIIMKITSDSIRFRFICEIPASLAWCRDKRINAIIWYNQSLQTASNSTLLLLLLLLLREPSNIQSRLNFLSTSSHACCFKIKHIQITSKYYVGGTYDNCTTPSPRPSQATARLVRAPTLIMCARSQAQQKNNLTKCLRLAHSGRASKDLRLFMGCHDTKTDTYDIVYSIGLGKPPQKGTHAQE